jgi:hypothetical protein
MSIFTYWLSSVVARPDVPGFFPIGLLERMCTSTIEELKHAIWDEIATINQELFTVL